MGANGCMTGSTIYMPYILLWTIYAPTIDIWIFNLCWLFVYSYWSRHTIFNGIKIKTFSLVICSFQQNAMENPACLATPPETILALLWTTVAVFGIVYALLGMSQRNFSFMRWWRHGERALSINRLKLIFMGNLLFFLSFFVPKQAIDVCAQLDFSAEWQPALAVCSGCNCRKSH